MQLFPDSFSYVKWSEKTLWKEIRVRGWGRGYLCTQGRQLKCVLHDISLFTWQSKWKIGWDAPHLLKCHESRFCCGLMWPRCPSELPVPKTNCCHCSLMRRKGEAAVITPFHYSTFLTAYLPHVKKKNPSLQKALQAESGGFNTDKKRREAKQGEIGTWT